MHAIVAVEQQYCLYRYVHLSSVLGNSDYLFFLLKNLRYFNVYNTNEVCSIKNYICENLMYLKLDVKIATIKIR